MTFFFTHDYLVTKLSIDNTLSCYVYQFKIASSKQQ